MKPTPTNKVSDTSLSVSERWIDLRMIAAMRVLLALSALLVIYIDPLEPDRLVVPTYVALGGYAVYSVLLFFLSARLSRMFPFHVLHWIDVSWYLLLISLSSGTNSIFFFFFFSLFFLPLIPSRQDGQHHCDCLHGHSKRQLCHSVRLLVRSTAFPNRCCFGA